MFAVVVGCGLCLSPTGSPFVQFGMPRQVVQALMREKPIILNIRGDGSVRAVQYPHARLTVEFDEKRRVLLINERGEEEATAEAELERLAKALPEGFKRIAGIPMVRSGEKGGEGTEVYGYCRLRVARMTSDTTAKITISYYLNGKNGEEEYATLFIRLSWYRGWWTVTKYEGDTRTEAFQNKLTAHIDEVSGNRPKR